MKKTLLSLSMLALLAACTKQNFEPQVSRDEAVRSLSKAGLPAFAEAGSLDIGTTGAAEISAYDELTQRLFVVNNSSGANRIDVLDLSNPEAITLITSINIAQYGGVVNSVAVSNGLLAAAIEASDKTSPGKVVVFNTQSYQVVAQVQVGSLPDMVCFSPNGKLILTANEGEPNSSYTIDPVGSVSIIDVEQGFAVSTIDFSAFETQKETLKAAGLRIFGPNASLAQDLEPEYVAVGANSQEAWVTLQENNGIAHIDLSAKTIRQIMPLGFKDHSLAPFAMDASDQDNIKGNFLNWNVLGMYQPDAIAANPYASTPFVYTANEGDARDYTSAPGYVEARRVSSLNLDATAFPNAAFLKANANLGRLNVTKANGDTDGDGDYDQLYAFGGRSFSIWHGKTGELVFDSKKELDSLTLANVTGSAYPENRNDDKGAEPEGLTIGRVGNTTLLFVGLERADAVVVYNITNPIRPVFMQWLNTGDAPEGVLFVDGSKRADGKALLIVSSEEDGVVKVFRQQ